MTNLDVIHKKKKSLASASQTRQNGHMKMLYQTLPVLSKAKAIKLMY